MFYAQQLATNQTVWRSSQLDACGVRHVFTTRHWDVKSADDIADVIGASGQWGGDASPRIVMAKQVHADAVSTPGRRLSEADAHVAADPAEVVAVRTADCVPVLLSAPDGRVVAAVHAGWRGLDPAVNVIGRAVAALNELAVGGGGGGVIAAVGPCISAARYEVGEEVAARFRERVPQAVIDGLGPKPHLDPRAVAIAQLREAGLAEQHIDVFPGCTHDDPALFSYRQHGPGVGHLAAIIAARPAS